MAPLLTLLAGIAAWTFKLYYDTSSYEEERLFAWLFWPAAVATCVLACRSVHVWLPAHWRVVVRHQKWTYFVARGVCGIVMVASIAAFGRILIFVKSDNWYFDAMWAYYPAPGVVFTGMPLVSLFGAIGLWPRRRDMPRDVVTIAFSALSLFLLVQLWRFLTQVGCSTCSGPAM